jgi:hypothetical protein
LKLSQPFGTGIYDPTTVAKIEFQMNDMKNPIVSGSPGIFSFSTKIVENAQSYLVD